MKRKKERKEKEKISHLLTEEIKTGVQGVGETDLAIKGRGNDTTRAMKGEGKGSHTRVERMKTRRCETEGREGVEPTSRREGTLWWRR